MSEEVIPHLSGFGWQISLPPGFSVCASPAGGNNYFGKSRSERFHIAACPELQFTWDIIGCAPLAEEAVCRFLHLIDRGSPVDLAVFNRVLIPIAPPVGTIEKAAVLQTQAGGDAVEYIEVSEEETGPIRSYHLLFPWPERRWWHSSQMPALMQGYPDPFEKGLLFAYREEVVGVLNGAPEAITLGEPEYIQRFTVSGALEDFAKAIVVARACALSFQFVDPPPDVKKMMSESIPSLGEWRKRLVAGSEAKTV